jgi:hypothetical protein
MVDPQKRRVTEKYLPFLSSAFCVLILRTDRFPERR